MSPEISEFHTFISYTTRGTDSTLARRLVYEYIACMHSLCEGARAIYVPVFLDRLQLDQSLGGDALKDALRDGLTNSAFTTSFISPEYVASPWCMFEYGLATGVSAVAPRTGDQRSPTRPVDDVLAIRWRPARAVDEPFQRDVIDISSYFESETPDWRGAFATAVAQSARFLQLRYRTDFSNALKLTTAYIQGREMPPS
jgi:hypothetical protein